MTSDDRAPAKAEKAAAAAEAGSSLPLRPTPVRIRRPDDPITTEQSELRERLVAQRVAMDAEQVLS
ncbi:hypothetical protein [Kitasatospora sp. A2-31]|uniref:hypothetical protein n=1 Tax=Kitasatospora sp. A2-31 TaxID=2916414 RepID=UPI001EEC2B0F|nr:hypothetical protein [Kitasatospora sp. A2-31]MCG6497041.1 hypothetical protein [Kitasatospora sp. A2-31]